MKKIMLIAFFAIFTLSNCSSNDEKNEDCFNCKTGGSGEYTGVYCYTEGNDFYTYTLLGDTEQVSLNGASWSTVKTTLLSTCDE